MGNAMTVDAIQYDEVAFNSEEDFEQCRSSYSTFIHIESEQLVASITHHDKKISVWKFNEHTIHPFDRKTDTMKNVKQIKLDYNVVEEMLSYLDAMKKVENAMNNLNSYLVKIENHEDSEEVAEVAEVAETEDADDTTEEVMETEEKQE